eukprot:SAG11_NODE_1217_length_5498_cov_3.519444_3_plen_196_part_00
MPALAKYLKARGMKLGLYTARNYRTCSGRMPGSLGNEAIDARTFASMGAEFVKNDDCGVIYAHAAEDYGAMEQAIAAVPHVEMIHSVKAPDLGPADAPKVCQFRRVGKDLLDTWEDTMRLLDTANDERFLSQVGPGFFSDLDMLVRAAQTAWQAAPAAAVPGKNCRAVRCSARPCQLLQSCTVARGAAVLTGSGV